MKKHYKIEAEWQTRSPAGDAKGTSKSTWSGKVSVDQNGTILGVVSDEGQTETTHLVGGTFFEQYGIELIKYNILNSSYDPILFLAVAAPNSKDYTGEFRALTPFSMYLLGYSKISVEEITLTAEEQAQLQAQIDQATEVVNEKEFTRTLLFHNATNANFAAKEQTIKNYHSLGVYAGPYTDGTTTD